MQGHTDHAQRPYAIATAGEVLSTSYERHTATFSHRFLAPPVTSIPSTPAYSEIFVPSRIYRGANTKIIISATGQCRWDEDTQRLFVWFEDKPGMSDKERVRRIDLFVPDRADLGSEDGRALQGILVVMIIGLASVLAWVLIGAWHGETRLHVM
jgi:hypothetical protein